MSKIKNTNLEVSSFALDCVKAVVDGSVDDGNYKTLVKKMSTLIQKNGYIGTLVFCFSKGKPEHKEVLKNIIAWHKTNSKLKHIKLEIEGKLEFKDIKDDDFQNYIKFITSVNQNGYMLITREMMVLFGWVKRFADGIIKDKKENEKGSGKNGD